MGSRRILWPLGGLLVLFAVELAAADDFGGRWKGVVSLASGEVDILVDLERTAEGWSGTLSAPSLELEDVELSDFEVEDQRIAFTAAGLGNGVRLTGEIGAGGRLIGESVEGPPGAAPATDIFLFEVEDLDAWTPSAPTNITDRDGYDNQPHFLPDGSAILYTSIRDGQADIYRYTLAAGSTTQVTDTPESEYSPTPMPWGSLISTVRVEDDGTQRLWGFRPDGSGAQLLLENVKPVGYHAWLSDHAVALFVLGDPPSLEIANLETGETRQIAKGIGRSLHSIPGSGQLSFVRKLGELGFVDAYDPWTSLERKLVETRPGSEDLWWTADGRILMGEGSKLYLYRPGPRAEVDPWVEIADLEPFGVRGITRLAISPDQRRLAVVGDRAVAAPPAPAPRPFELERQ